MIFKNIIDPKLSKFFYFSEVNDGESDVKVSYMDVIDDCGLMDDFKKSIIRELRLSKLLDGVDIDDKIKMINEIKDPNILLSDRSKQMGFTTNGSSSLSVNNYVVETDRKIDIIKEFNHIDSVEKIDLIYRDVYNIINKTLEEEIVKEYLELAKINKVKMELFFNKNTFDVEYDSTMIMAKINTASEFILKGNRKERGNIILINPLDHGKLKYHLDHLNMEVMSSKFIPQNNILVSVKSSGVEFHRIAYKLDTLDFIHESTMGKNRRFVLSFGTERTSIRPESNCILISIN